MARSSKSAFGSLRLRCGRWHGWERLGNRRQSGNFRGGDYPSQFKHPPTCTHDDTVRFSERRQKCGECRRRGRRATSRTRNARTGATADARARRTAAGRRSNGWPSSDNPPPGTDACACGWWVVAESDVCSIDVMPTLAPSGLASTASVRIVRRTWPSRSGWRVIRKIRHNLFTGGRPAVVSSRLDI